MSLSHTLAHSIAKKDISSTDLFNVLTKYNLLSLLPKVLEILKKIEIQTHNREIIHIESPFEINKPALNAIIKIVGNTHAEQKVIINKKVLAGFKARFGGKLYDGSAQRVLKQLVAPNT